MRCSDCINIILLHQTYIFPVHFWRNIFSCFHICIVAVYPFDQQTFSIKRNGIVVLRSVIILSVRCDLCRCKMQLTKTYVLAYAFIVQLSLSIIQRNYQRIKVWMIRIPQRRFVDRKRYL